MIDLDREMARDPSLWDFFGGLAGEDKPPTTLSREERRKLSAFGLSYINYIALIHIYHHQNTTDREPSRDPDDWQSWDKQFLSSTCTSGHEGNTLGVTRTVLRPSDGWSLPPSQ